jgi:hypothetical protein
MNLRGSKNAEGKVAELAEVLATQGRLYCKDLFKSTLLTVLNLFIYFTYLFYLLTSLITYLIYLLTSLINYFTYWLL